MSSLPDVKHVEGDHVKIVCKITAGNPASTIIYWTKPGDSGFRQSGSTLAFTSITRSQSGVYTCVAENNYISKGKGVDEQSFLLSVLCRHLFAKIALFCKRLRLYVSMFFICTY